MTFRWPPRGHGWYRDSICSTNKPGECSLPENWKVSRATQRLKKWRSSTTVTRLLLKAICQGWFPLFVTRKYHWNTWRLGTPEDFMRLGTWYTPEDRYHWSGRLRMQVMPWPVWLTWLGIVFPTPFARLSGSTKQKITCSIPIQGTCLGCGFSPPVGVQTEVTHWCFPPSLPFFPSL